MQKIQDYVLKDKMIFVGLEDSKSTWRICVRNQGMIVDQTSMPTRYENLRNYLKSRYPGCNIKLIYEAGFGGFWLHDLLEADGIDCIVTPPNKVTEEKVNRVKTDRIDARRLSKNLENNDYRSCHVPDQERRADRQISRTLLMIQKDIIRTKNRIRRFLDFHGLNDLVNPGRWTGTEYKRLRTIDLRGTLHISFELLLKELDQLLEHRRYLRKELYALTMKARYSETYHHLKSTPGIGWLTAIRLVLEWGEDLTHFSCGKSFSNYLGLTSSEYSTGQKTRRGRITGQGHGFVRAWLIQCSWIAIRKDPVLLKKFQNVWKNSGSKKKAIVAVARKLSVRLWHLVVFNEDYQLGLLEERQIAA
jgi:transposase